MYIHVKVSAGAKKEKFEEVKKGHFEAFVREPAERNLANGRVRALLAKHLGLPEGKVRLISGHRNPGKIFRVDM